GYSHYALVTGLLLAKALDVKVLLRGDTHLNSENKSWMKGRLKNKVFPSFLRAVDGCLAIGALNKEFYRHYGVPDDRIFMMPHAVDNEFFQKKSQKTKSMRQSMKERLGLDPEHPVILFASKLLGLKRPRDLLDTYIRLSPDDVREPTPYLMFVGDSEER